MTFSSQDYPTPRSGVLKAGGIHPFAPHVRSIDVIRAEDDYVAAPESVPMDQVTLHAPIRPHMIVAIGKNYADHASEMASEAPDHPLIFSKFPSAITGHRHEINWRTSITHEVDWEGELGVVIGKTAKDVGEADALDYVFGYTVANDVTARDLQKRIDKQWTRGKSLDTFCPIGPVIVTRADVDNPQNLDVTTTINGDVMQQGNTADMLFSIPYLVSYCSQMFTLRAGDLLLTGTPAGVGAGRKPPVFLKDGDEVTVTIDSIGTLTNTCRTLD
ncbi:MAG: fumarylacetoacetate hydrolase family protein [Chloroflexota bacterium]